jgi:hypothetical protein
LDENWMMCVSRVLRCLFFIWSPINIHPKRMLFIHERMISSQRGTAYLMNVVGLLLTAGRYWQRDDWQNLPMHRQNRPGTLGFRPGIWFIHGRKMAASPFSGLMFYCPLLRTPTVSNLEHFSQLKIYALLRGKKTLTFKWVLNQLFRVHDLWFAIYHSQKGYF